MASGDSAISLSIDDKVDMLSKIYNTSKVMIKRVLKREDIREDLDAASKCLQEMNIGDAQKNDERKSDIKEVVKIQQPGLNKLTANGVTDKIMKSVEQEHNCIISLDRNTSPHSTSSSTLGDVSGANKVHGSSDNSSHDNDESIDDSDESSDDSDDEDPVACSKQQPVVADTEVMYGNARLSWKTGNIVNENADVLVGPCIGVLASLFNIDHSISSSPGNIEDRVPSDNLRCHSVLLVHCCECKDVSAKSILENAVGDCLKKAVDMDVQSIAFSIIGTGALEFPRNEACRIVINKVINVVGRWDNKTSVNDVRFVFFDKDQQLVSTFKQQFNAAIQNYSSSSITVSVEEGDLLVADTDAIVNIIGAALHLNNAGNLSKMIATAYPSVQSELLSLKRQPAGPVVLTKSDGKNILHAICPTVNQQTIQSAIENCLQEADNKGYGTVGLPAFGTGAGHLNVEESAEAMFKGISNVLQKLTNLKKITIVIYGDLGMLTTFQQVQKQHNLGPTKQFSKTKSNANTDTSAFRKPLVKSKPSLPLQITISGKHIHNVKDAAVSLKERFAEYCKEQVVKNEDICKLSFRQRTAVIKEGNKLGVAITFESDRIVIQGNPENLPIVINDIWRRIQKRSKKESDAKQAKLLYKTVCWQYELDGKPCYFKRNVNFIIENAFVNKEQRVEVEIHGKKFAIDLAKYTGQEQATGKVITVKRTNREDISLPRNWSPMPIKDGREVTVHLVSLKPGSKEYQHVLDKFKTTGGVGEIVKIERIQNPHLYKQYMVHKKKMDKENGTTNNEMELFHGTSEKNIDDINKTNLNRSFRGVHGVVYGDGVYFATDASYSMGYTEASESSGYSHMYLARVLVGRYKQGSQGLLVPPRSYDSVDNGKKSVFVVFYDSQCYPAYLITFCKEKESNLNSYYNCKIL